MSGAVRVTAAAAKESESCFRVRATNRIDADFRQRRVPNVARFDQIGNRADGVFDGNIRIEARRTVDIDVIDTETLQCIGEEILHCGGASVDAEKTALGRSECAE